MNQLFSFRKNKSLKQLIGGSTIENDENIKKSSNKYEGKCTPCKSGIRSLCCSQVQNTHIHFEANKMDGYLQFSTKSTAKAIFVVYLLKCKKRHKQYVGKAEIGFNLRLNNHHKDVYKSDTILASRHFAMKKHIFNRDASFLIIRQIRKSTLSRGTKKNLLKQRENFWILKLQALKPKGLNQELNMLRNQTNALPSHGTFIFLQCILINQIHR